MAAQTVPAGGEGPMAADADPPAAGRGATPPDSPRRLRAPGGGGLAAPPGSLTGFQGPPALRPGGKLGLFPAARRPWPPAAAALSETPAEPAPRPRAETPPSSREPTPEPAPEREWRPAEPVWHPPVPMTASIAQDLEARHQCRGLGDVLGENRALFREGWEFVCILWGGAEGPPYHRAPPDREGWEYLTLEVDNRWSDLALLRRGCHCYGEEGGAGDCYEEEDPTRPP